MYIELIDLLRCPREHEETWLVAAFTKLDDRFVVEAKLGCPVCNASYVIQDGAADFREQPDASKWTSAKTDPDEAIRIAAFLNLTRPGSTVILEGRYASEARTVSEMTQCRVIALNPASLVEDSETVAVVLADSRIPFGSASIDGVALDNEHLALDTGRILRPSARLLIPSSESLPPGFTELARDNHLVVGEAAGLVTPLTRRR